jgi:hypothetical protein
MVNVAAIDSVKERATVPLSSPILILSIPAHPIRPTRRVRYLMVRLACSWVLVLHFSTRSKRLQKTAGGPDLLVETQQRRASAQIRSRFIVEI